MLDNPWTGVLWRHRDVVDWLELHGEVDDRADGYACWTLCQPRFSLIYPASCCYVEMDPRGVFGEFFYEPGAGNGAAAFAGAGVADVGDVAFDHFFVFVVHGHGPHFFAYGLGAFEELIEIFAGGAEGSHVDVC